MILKHNWNNIQLKPFIIFITENKLYFFIKKMSNIEDYYNNYISEDDYEYYY